MFQIGIVDKKKHNDASVYKLWLFKVNVSSLFFGCSFLQNLWMWSKMLIGLCLSEMFLPDIMNFMLLMINTLHFCTGINAL